MATDMTMDEDYDDLEDDGGLSGFWILIIFIAVLAAFGVIVKIAYDSGPGVRAASDVETLPVVSADPTPVRSEVELDPVAPGRQEVYDELNEVETRVVAEANPAEDPLTDYAADEVTPINVPTSDEVASNYESVGSDRAAVEDLPTTQEPVETAVAEVEEEATPAPPPSQKPAVQSVAANNTPATTTRPAAGTYAVQVGAYGSTDEAMGVYGQLMKKYGAFVGNRDPEVNVATVKGKVYHRLWIGAFETRESANTYCTELSNLGQNCYVQRR